MNRMIEYKNMAGEERSYERNGRRRAKRVRRTEKRSICPCGHEVCGKCLRLTWERALNGETVKCCACPRQNEVRFLSTTVALPEVSDEQAQAVFDWER